MLLLCKSRRHACECGCCGNIFRPLERVLSCVISDLPCSCCSIRFIHATTVYVLYPLGSRRIITKSDVQRWRRVWSRLIQTNTSNYRGTSLLLLHSGTVVSVESITVVLQTYETRKCYGMVFPQGNKQKLQHVMSLSVTEMNFNKK